MITMSINATGNVYRRETGVQSFLRLEYEANYPCAGRAACQGWGAANHVDDHGPEAYNWVKKAAEHPEVWHRKSDGASLDLPLSAENQVFVAAKLAEFGRMPAKGHSPAEVEASRIESAKLFARICPPEQPSRA